MSNLFGINAFNLGLFGNAGYPALPSQSLIPSNPFGSLFSASNSFSSSASILPLVMRQSAGLQSASGSGEASGLMQMLMLMKLLGGLNGSSGVFGPSITQSITQATPVVDPKIAKTQALKDKLKSLIAAVPGEDAFSLEQLRKVHKGERVTEADAAKDLYGDQHRQDNETIRLAYGGKETVSPGGAHKTTAQLVADGKFKTTWDWTLSKLTDAFGSVGATNLASLQATKDLNQHYWDRPYHLAMAQQNLDHYNQIQSEMSSLGIQDSELESLLGDLKEKAKLHFQVSAQCGTPIVFDTDGSGKIELTDVKNGVQFDIDGDGKKEQIAWTQAKGDKTDGWLALDRNGNGSIDSGKELFGNQHGQANGYEELKKFDDNKDGVIDAKDAIYAKLKTWKDTNHDGISQASEMQDLKSAGVESVKIGYQNSTETDAHGNQLRQQSAFTRTDAAAAKLAQDRGGSAAQFKSGLSVDAWLQLQSA